MKDRRLLRRIFGILITVSVLSISLPACQSAKPESEDTETESIPMEEITDRQPAAPHAAEPIQNLYGKAVFQGVRNYKTVSRDRALSPTECIYSFRIGDRTECFRVKCRENDYSIQNRLMEGYTYMIQVENGTVISAELADKTDTMGIVKNYTPGLRTLKNFLSAAIAPIGSTLYVFGGGWNYEDDGSSYLARNIGVSPTWEKFYQTTDENYAYDAETYPDNGWNTYYYAGLDCSGYVGWVLYNTFYTETEAEPGFVEGASIMAKHLSSTYRFGTWRHFSPTRPAKEGWQHVSDSFHPGDVVSTSGHVYLVIGTCEDHSAVILHSTVNPSVSGVIGGGVQLSAVSMRGANDKSCQAYQLANAYMEKYYPEWTARYPVVTRSADSYFAFSNDKAYTGVFSWGKQGLTDPDGIRDMTAEEVLKTLFDE